MAEVTRCSECGATSEEKTILLSSIDGFYGYLCWDCIKRKQEAQKD